MSEEMRVVRKPLSLYGLHEAYLSATFGYNEPDILRCSPKTSELLARKMSPYARKLKRFNNAYVVEDASVPENKLRFENSRYQPHNCRKNGIKEWWLLNVEVELTD